MIRSMLIAALLVSSYSAHSGAWLLDYEPMTVNMEASIDDACDIVFKKNKDLRGIDMINADNLQYLYTKLLEIDFHIDWYPSQSVLVYIYDNCKED